MTFPNLIKTTNQNPTKNMTKHYQVIATASSYSKTRTTSDTEKTFLLRENIVTFHRLKDKIFQIDYTLEHE